MRRRPEDTVAINLRAVSHIKVGEFTMREEESGEKGIVRVQPLAEKAVVGIRPINNWGGL